MAQELHFSDDVIVNKTEINIGGNFRSFKETRQMHSHAKDMNAQYHFHNSHQTAVSLLIVFPSSKLKVNGSAVAWIRLNLLKEDADACICYCLIYDDDVQG